MRAQSDRASFWRSNLLYSTARRRLKTCLAKKYPSVHIDPIFRTINASKFFLFSEEAFYRPFIKFGRCALWGFKPVWIPPELPPLPKTFFNGGEPTSTNDVPAGYFFSRILPQTEYSISKGNSDDVNPEVRWFRVSDKDKDPLYISQSTNSYFHFITEIIPVALHYCSNFTPIIQVTTEWQERALRAFDLEPIEASQKLPHGKVSFVKKTQWGVYPISNLVLEARERLRKSPLFDANPPTRKIFVTRHPSSSSTGRLPSPLTTESFRAKFSMEVIEPAALDPLEQLLSFGSATAIAGPHGSAMANLIACREGTVVREINQPNKIRWHVERLSRILGLDYALLVSQPSQNNEISYAPSGLEF